MMPHGNSPLVIYNPQGLVGIADNKLPNVQLGSSPAAIKLNVVDYTALMEFRAL
jgi:hypothetical protein